MRQNMSFPKKCFIFVRIGQLPTLVPSLKKSWIQDILGIHTLQQRRLRGDLAKLIKPISQFRVGYYTTTIRLYHDAFDYDGSDRNYDLRSIRLRYDYDTTTTNKKAQLSLTNPRDACEKFARFT